MFNIDHFKNVNDTHGHPIGDRVLVALAKHARAVFRIDDFIARYGGEEFSVLLRASSIEYRVGGGREATHEHRSKGVSISREQRI